MNYYNTTWETGEQVDLFTKINDGQDKKVLEIIRKMQTFSASKVWQKYIHTYFKKGTPLTSIRRSITTLKKAGYITETGDRVMGIYGRKELEYKLLNYKL